jgi:hypothetical protein
MRYAVEQQAKAPRGQQGNVAMKRLHIGSTPAPRRARLWLAASNGRRLPSPAGDVAPIDQPERPLEVEFIGLSELEQLRALAGFPGGRRFVLKPLSRD